MNERASRFVVVILSVSYIRMVERHRLLATAIPFPAPCMTFSQPLQSLDPTAHVRRGTCRPADDHLRNRHSPASDACVPNRRRLAAGLHPSGLSQPYRLPGRQTPLILEVQDRTISCYKFCTLSWRRIRCSDLHICVSDGLCCD